MLQGLPASGKTTWAKDLLKREPGKWKRINKDDLRAMLDDGKWSKTNEALVIEARNALVKLSLSHGFNVIIDDTNFHEKHYVYLKTLAYDCGADFEINREFCKTPLFECLKRDMSRKVPVGSNVIISMWNKYLRKNPPIHISSKKDCYVFDIDGTLARMTKRHAYAWDEVDLDAPIHSSINLLKTLAKSADILIVSGRDGSCEAKTVSWLARHAIPYEHLIMRKPDDTRKDFVVKDEIRKRIQEDYNILGVFDDRDQVVSTWRSHGIPCYQVDYGAF